MNVITEARREQYIIYLVYTIAYIFQWITCRTRTDSLIIFTLAVFISYDVVPWIVSVICIK